MCVLCKDYLIKNLNIREVQTAGMELLYTAENDEERDHIDAKINELIDKLLKEENE